MPTDAADSPSDPLAAAVAARRRVVGLTQVETARLAGCGPDFLYDLENGKPTIRLDKLLAVLRVLGLELVLGEGRRGLAVSRTDFGELA